MDDLTQIQLVLNDHKNEIGSLKHRMDDQEKQQNTITELVVSVKELAINMKNMLDEQKAQNDRIQKLEEKPAKRWDTLVDKIISVVIGAAVGYMTSFFF